MTGEELTDRVGEAALKVFHLKPDDVVLIGNLDAADDHALADTMDKLAEVLPTTTKLFAFARDIQVDVARAAAVGYHQFGPDEEGAGTELFGFVYNAGGDGVRQDLVDQVMAAWAAISPDGSPSTPLRNVDQGYINHVDNLARIAALAVVKALAEQP